MNRKFRSRIYLDEKANDKNILHLQLAIYYAQKRLKNEFDYEIEPEKLTSFIKEINKYPLKKQVKTTKIAMRKLHKSIKLKNLNFHSDNKH